MNETLHFARVEEGILFISYQWLPIHEDNLTIIAIKARPLKEHLPIFVWKGVELYVNVALFVSLALLFFFSVEKWIGMSYHLWGL